MKKFSKALLAILIVFSTFMIAKPVKAEGEGACTVGTNEYAVCGTTTTLKTYLTMKQNATVPNLTVTYTVSAGSAVDGTGGYQSVKAGISKDDVTVSNAVFSTADTANSATANEAGITNRIAVKKDISVDFTKVKFTSPGIYRYIITQTAVASPFELVGESTTTVDVIIVNDENGKLKVEGYLAYDGTFTKGAHETANANDKDDKFVIYYHTVSLEVTKKVEGNQADRGKNWNFTVQLSNLGNGTTILRNENSDVTPVSGYKADEDGKLTLEFVIKHGQKLILNSIPSGAKVTVTETEANQDGYTTTYKVSENGAHTGNSASDVTLSAENGTEIEVINTKAGNVPTGIMTAILPGSILVAASVLYFAVRKNEEE